MLQYKGYRYVEANWGPTLRADELDGPLGHGAYLDLLMLPSSLQGSGSGRATYETWERDLPEHIDLVYILPTAEARGFWRRLGFVPVYFDEDPDIETEEMLWARSRDGRGLVPVRIDWDEWEDLQIKL